MTNSTKTIASVAGLLLVGGVAAFSFTSKSAQAPQTAAPATTQVDATKELTTTPIDTAAATGTTDTATNAAQEPTSGYKDGTYTATGTYRTPQSSEKITVTLTLKSGVVTDASVAFPETRERESRQYQSQFVSGYSQLVVGKNISEINLSRVSGSSLTPIGFNAALEQIKTQAKA